MLEISEISRSSYYKWKNTKDNRAKKYEEEELIKAKIKELYNKHKGRYGVKRMTHELKRNNIHINHKKAYRIMKENGYLSVVKRKKRYKKSAEENPKQNILQRNFTTTRPYDKMATDVSEINMFGKKIYISPIKDLHTKMIESVEIGEHATLITVMKMIKKIE